MRRFRHDLAPLAAGALALAASAALGCAGINQREADVDRTPIVNHGAGATIIRPGHSAPPHPGNLHPREAGYGQQHAPGYGQQQAAQPQQQYGQPPQYGQQQYGQPPVPVPAPPLPYGAPPDVVAPGVMQPPPEYATGSPDPTAARGRNVVLLGGNETEETRHITVDENPLWMKYLKLPFAVAAAPFAYAVEKVRGEREPGPQVPRLEGQQRPEMKPAPPVLDYESARLQEMERELARRGSAPAPPAPHAGAAPQAAPSPFAGPAPAPHAAPSPQVAAPGAGSAIADELAALRRRTAAAPRPSAPATAPGRASGPHEAASGHVDRDGDGRTDHWIERVGGAVVREAYDEDFDGRPDRTLVYDASGREVRAIEEDTDFDGRPDAWTSLVGGEVVARRADTDGDGHVDAWSAYRGGVITRLERDADGDGFRDHQAFYRDGRLEREERDDDGDGRTDLVSYYDDGERLERVEEDADGDGAMDVVSHYEDGRLTRREVLDPSLLGPGAGATGPGGATEHN